MIWNLHKDLSIVQIKSDYNFIQKQFKEIKVVKGNTKKIIEASFLILFFDSSVIIHAINKGKKIVNLKSDLFDKKKFRTDIYNRYLKILTIPNSIKNINITSIARQIDVQDFFYFDYIFTMDEDNFLQIVRGAFSMKPIGKPAAT